MSRKSVKIAKMTDKKMAYANCVYLNPIDLEQLGMRDNEHLIVDECLVQRVRGDSQLSQNAIGTSNLQWAALHLDKDKALGTTVTIEPWLTSKQNIKSVANTISIVVDTYSKTKVSVSVEALEEFISQTFRNEVFCKDSKWIIEWKQGPHPFWLSLRIGNIYVSKKHVTGGLKDNVSLKLKNMDTVQFSTIDENTLISLISAQNPFIHLELPKGAQFAMSGPEWNAEKLGIGGLDNQFATIFRRAFASRLFPAETVKQLGVKHVKGMLLFGPPGTGKTLIARNIGAMLTDKEPKVVNGPEILNKYVGQSEENIRMLFADAEEDQKANGENASLHIVIFDEIDAICKQRGSTNTGTGVHDTVVNQLLSKIDGVNSLNNVLVIGMTNRKDLLDDALLRAGRLEVHIEIGLPNEEGRQQIFRIHCRSIRENGFLDEKISYSDLASRTKNYSGAEIEAVVRSAVSFAMQEHVDTESVSKIDARKLKNIKITQEYFDLALQEIKPEFGAKDEDLQFTFSRGIYMFNDNVKEIIHLGNTVVNRMRRSNVMNRQAILLRGNMGVGKTALAGYVASKANFPFLRVISADNYVGSSDSSICSNIAKIFNDAYKSQYSVIILDDLERLIGYTVGPRFSNPILQSLLTCIRRSPTDASRKILIIATCSYDVIRSLQIDKVFDFIRDVPSVQSKKEFYTVLNESQTSLLCQPNVDEIVNCWPTDIKVGISDLLTILELATDENDQITVKSFKYALESKFQNTINSNDLNIDIDFETKQDQ